MEDNVSVNLSESEINSYRELLSDQTAVTFLPAILVLALLLIVGAVGNTLVFYIYYTRFNASSSRSAILALASMDLLTCALCIPGEILDLRFAYSFTSEFLCRTLRMTTTLVLMASGLTLVTVAIDRYQRICHPLREQLSPKRAMIRVLVACSISLCFAIPAAVVYGLAKAPTPKPGVYGTECSTSDEYAHHKFRIVYSAALLVVFLAAFSTMFAIYTFIGRRVLRQNKYRKSVREKRVSAIQISTDRAPQNVVHPQSDSNDNELSISDGNKHSSQLQAGDLPELDLPSNASRHENGEGRQAKLSRKSSVFRRIRKMSQSGDVRTRKTTMMLFLITMVFVVSFLPHLILKAVQAVNKNVVDSWTTAGLVLYNIFVRSYFFNTAANPFIYSFCSPKFRHECKDLFVRLIFLAKKRRTSVLSEELQ